MGVAMLAAYGVGLFRSLSQVASKWVALGGKTAPKRKLANAHDRRVDTYQYLLEHLDSVSDTGTK